MPRTVIDALAFGLPDDRAQHLRRLRALAANHREQERRWQRLGLPDRAAKSSAAAERVERELKKFEDQAESQ